MTAEAPESPFRDPAHPNRRHRRRPALRRRLAGHGVVEHQPAAVDRAAVELRRQRHAGGAGRLCHDPEAVGAAAPGDLVLVSPGVYNEAVNVTTPELTIRGLDRNEVVLDREFELDNGITCSVPAAWRSRT